MEDQPVHWVERVFENKYFQCVFFGLLGWSSLEEMGKRESNLGHLCFGAAGLFFIGFALFAIFPRLTIILLKILGCCLGLLIAYWLLMVLGDWIKGLPTSSAVIIGACIVAWAISHKQSN